MAVNTAGLNSQLSNLFTNPPPSDDAAAARLSASQSWASAIQTYAATVTPFSTTVAAASTVLQADLYYAFSSGNVSTILTNMETAFATFALTVAGGMAGFIAVPPPLPVGFSTIPNAPSASTAATNWVSKINSWFITGTATPSGGGPVQNWV